MEDPERFEIIPFLNVVLWSIRFHGWKAEGADSTALRAWNELENAPYEVAIPDITADDRSTVATLLAWIRTASRNKHNATIQDACRQDHVTLDTCHDVARLLELFAPASRHAGTEGEEYEAFVYCRNIEEWSNGELCVWFVGRGTTNVMAWMTDEDTLHDYGVSVGTVYRIGATVLSHESNGQWRVTFLENLHVIPSHEETTNAMGFLRMRNPLEFLPYNPDQRWDNFYLEYREHPQSPGHSGPGKPRAWRIGYRNNRDPEFRSIQLEEAARILRAFGFAVGYEGAGLCWLVAMEHLSGVNQDHPVRTLTIAEWNVAVREGNAYVDDDGVWCLTQRGRLSMQYEAARVTVVATKLNLLVDKGRAIDGNRYSEHPVYYSESTTVPMLNSALTRLAEARLSVSALCEHHPDDSALEPPQRRSCVVVRDDWGTGPVIGYLVNESE